jgi:hypothetical protein
MKRTFHKKNFISGGEGGRDLTSYHLTPLPASASKQENLSIIRRKQFGGNILPAA